MNFSSPVDAEMLVEMVKVINLGNKLTLNLIVFYTENSDLDVSEPVQVVEKYEPGEGWCQSSCTLKKTHRCAKMIIVSKANSTLFTSRSNQESLKRDAQENSFKSYQSKKMVNDEYLDMHTSSFCTEAGCPGK